MKLYFTKTIELIRKNLLNLLKFYNLFTSS